MASASGGKHQVKAGKQPVVTKGQICLLSSKWQKFRRKKCKIEQEREDR